MRRFARQVRDAARRRVGASALVLTYHRVADLARDPQLLAVTPDKFDSQMRMLSQTHRVVPLAQLLLELRERRLVEGTVAVTFDDGYADNLTHAAPVLAANRVPATVFVSSGCIESGREFWWDEVERLILETPTLPRVITIEAGGVTYEASVDASTDEPGDPRWNLLLPDSGPRHRLYREICEFIRPLAASARADALAQLEACVGAAPLTRPSHRPLSPAEVAELDASPGIDIGAHSRDHDVLALRSPEQQHDAIHADKTALEALCGHAVETFSYPYGGPDDFSPTTTSIVKEAGFCGACANHPGLVKPWSDRFRVPRHVVRDWDAATLDRQVREWLGTAGHHVDRS